MTVEPDDGARRDRAPRRVGERRYPVSSRAALLRAAVFVILCACPPAVETDGGVALDGGRRGDSGMPFDAGTTADAGLISDAGVIADAGLIGDAGPADSGTARDAGWLTQDPCSWRWSVGAQPVVRGFRNVASDPTVLWAQGRYEMIFSSLDETSGDNLLASATSPDGLHWSDAGVVLRGHPGSWAEELESAELVLSDAGSQLYFAGYRTEINAALCTMYGICSDGFPASVGLASHRDAGLDFGDDSIVLSGTDGGFDGEATYSPTIARDGARWMMLYSGWCLRNCNPAAKGFLALLGASSTDGVHWVKEPTPVLERAAATSWRNRAVGEASFVQLPNGRWLLAFTAFTDDRLPDTSLALAWADQPFGPYTVCPAPFYLPTPPADGGGLESGGVIAPEIRVVNDTVQLWFTSRNLSATTDFGYFIRHANAEP